MATQRLGKINISYTVPQNQLQLYNEIGRTTGANMTQQQNNQGGNDNFFVKRGKSIENAFGTTGAAIASDFKSGGLLFKGTENVATEDLRKERRNNMNDIAKKFGYNTWTDWQDAYEEARNAKDTAKITQFKKQLKEFQAQANANAAKADEKANNFKDYRENNYVSNKINQDRGKFLGSAMNTLSTGADVLSMATGVPTGALINAGQGAWEGVADELEQNGFENFDAVRAGQNAAIGAATGAITGALNKGINKRLDAKGGNLFKGNNFVTQGLNKFNATNPIGKTLSTIGAGATRGAQSGLVGGAVGAGLSSAMNNVGIGEGIRNVLQGAGQGAVQGAMTGGAMAGANLAANAALNKVAPNTAKAVRENQLRNQSYGDKLRDQFKGAWNSGDSPVTEKIIKPTTKYVNDKINDLKADGVGDFGYKYNQFSDDSSKAIDYLLKRKDGEVEGVINSPAVESITGDGNVGLVYGKTGDDGFGLAHIVEKHGKNVAEKIPSILENGKILNDPSLTNNNRITIVNDDNTGAVRLDWDGKEKQWVVTAYEGLPYSSAPNANSQTAGSVALRGSSVQSQDGATVTPIITQNKNTVNGMGGSWQDLDTLVDRSIAAAMPEANINSVKDAVLENVADKLQRSGIFDSYEVGEMSDSDYRNNVVAAVNDSVIELAEQQAQAPTSVNSTQPTTQAVQTDPWDRAAQQGGYASYDDVIESYKLANPGVEVGANDAGKILTWMDNNPGDWNPNAPKTTTENPQTAVYDALTSKQNNLSEVPTSDQIKNKRLLVEEITKQFNAVEKPVTRSTKPNETFYNLYEDWGLSDGDEIRQAVSYADQGALIPQMVREAAGETGVIDLSDAQGMVMDLKINKKASAKMVDALENIIDSTDTTIVGGKQGVDALQLQRTLEQMASDARGTNGTYHIGKTVVDETMARNLERIARNIGDKLDEAAVQKGVVQNVLNRHAGDIQAMRNAFPNNQKWQDAIDTKIVGAKTIGDLRHSMKDLVRANIFIENGDENYGSFGGRMAAGNDVPTSKSAIRNKAVNWAWDKIQESPQVRDMKLQKYDSGMRSDGTAPTNNATMATVTEQAGNNGTVVNPQVASPVELANMTANYNPSTQLYNAIGRTEGLSNAEQANAANYLVDAVQEAEIMPTATAPTSLETALTPIATANGSTALYDALGGTSAATSAQTTTQPTQSTNKKGYFDATGDYWTDMLASAMSSAIDANDVNAFATLYGMYQDQLANLQKQATDTSTSTTATKLTDKQRQANAAARALEDFEQAESNFGYDVSDIPILGNVANFGGNDYLSKAEALALQIGYMLSGATINKDEAKKIGMAYVPQPRDSEAVRKSKLNQLRGIISDYQQTYAESE